MRDQTHHESVENFLQHYLQNAQHLMWFLGAGTSRSAGLPTATDIIWDLKLHHYCLHENQDLQLHDINNKAVKQKIQTYMDSKGYPTSGSPEEYSFYFNLTFGDNYAAQQNYINEALSGDKVSLNVGHRALAALLEMGKIKIIFTTNFDEVIETSYANVSRKNLSVFHLEGSYAALNALNSERFPFYAKIHGDFRYQSIKNLAKDLRDNDSKLQECFLAASTRYGLIVSGYSGRDNNVMTMFREAMDQNNAFPYGFFWTVPRICEAAESIEELLEEARNKGVQANIVETGTFDEMLSRIWRQVEGKPQLLDNKVRTAKVASVSIPLPSPGKQYPILRTNALPIIKTPEQCGTVDLCDSITFSEMKEKVIEKSPNAILSYTDRILFWGDEAEVLKVLTDKKIKSLQPFEFSNEMKERVAYSSILKSFFEEALVTATCSGKPLLIRRRAKNYYAVVRADASGNEAFADLRNVLSSMSQNTITGSVPGLPGVTWAEAVSIHLEDWGDNLWVLLRPDIWIRPLTRRQEARDFLRQLSLKRYNKRSFRLLDAWIKILLGSLGHGNVVEVACFQDSTYGAAFEIGTRSAYSRRYGNA